jgi:transcriptional regulator of acetoin/glycerol metabolism
MLEASCSGAPRVLHRRRPRPCWHDRRRAQALFLDEIDSASTSAQAVALSRVSGSALSAVHAFTINVRIVAATNADVEEQVKEGRFGKTCSIG